MKNFFLCVLATVSLLGIALAQTSSSQPSTKLSFAPGTIIRVELVKSIDAKKAKVGDEIVSKTMDDFLAEKNEVLAPKGSKVLAHTAEVAPRQGDSASTLGIVFDKMILKDGSEVPLKAAIQAIGPPESNAVLGGSDPIGLPGATGGMSPMPSGGRGGNDGGGSMGSGGRANAGNTGAITQDSTYPASDAAINGRLTPNAKGVVGISGLSLSTGSAQDSLLTSQKHNVKLDSGTQMILRVAE
jgi:hypothetical protein